MFAMPSIKNNPLPTQLSSETRSVESVREWRHAVDEFFTEDWPKLTDLILSIEESLWGEDNLERISDVLEGNTLGDPERDAKHSTEPEPEIYDSHRERVPAAAEPEQKRRLEQLAKKIEERLKKTKLQEEK